jgi:creatinine amidohydrolase/Fe(II)-dependent formamide hydrolase-like protein
VAVQPLGAVEQHGPHLPVSTDFVTATEIAAAAVGLADVPCVLLPGLAYTLTGASAGPSASAPSELGMGVHGGHGETSLMLHLRPELVRMDLARPNVPDELAGFRHIGFGKRTSFEWTSDDVGPDGHIGDPTGATAEDGKRFYQAAVPLLAETTAEASRFAPSGSRPREDRT